MSEHPNPPLPPLTAADFDSGSGYTFRGVPVIEDESGTHIYTYGHVAPEVMAGAVTDYDDEMAGPLGDDEHTAAEDVQHLYAVTIKTPDDPEGWWMSWREVAAETPGAFPITVVSR